MGAMQALNAGEDLPPGEGVLLLASAGLQSARARHWPIFRSDGELVSVAGPIGVKEVVDRWWGSERIARPVTSRYGIWHENGGCVVLINVRRREDVAEFYITVSIYLGYSHMLVAIALDKCTNFFRHQKNFQQNIDKH